MKAMRGRIALQSTSCETLPRLVLFRPDVAGLSECVRVLASLFFGTWSLVFEAYLELEVRDLPVRIRGPSSSFCFGFPSASTPLPV